MTAARFDERIYYEDQTSWGPADFYALFRYLNRMLLNRRGAKTAEIAALDLERMSAETRYLMKHMLLLTRRYEPVLEQFPNLRGLDDVGELGHDLVLDEHPTQVRERAHHLRFGPTRHDGQLSAVHQFGGSC